MAITYNTRIAAQQGNPITLRIGTIAQLNPATAQSGAGATYNSRNIINGTDFFTYPQPLPGAAASIASGTIINDVVTRILSPQIDAAFPAPLNDDIISSLVISGSSPPNTLPYLKTTIPTFPTSVSDQYFDVGFTVPSGWIDQTQYPPFPILNGLGQLRLTASVNAVRNDIDPSAGQIALLNPAFMSTSIEAKWEGYDLIIGNGGYGASIATRPYADLSANYLMFSGVYLGNGTRPLLIQAQLNGQEAGRFYIKLNDPIWDAVLAQPVATHSVSEILPCNFGWYGVFNINTVTPSAFILFNPDCTQYWIYILQAIDDAALNAVANTQWGQTGSERLFIDAPLANTNASNALIIIGAGSDDTAASTLLGNAPTNRVLLPSFTPFIPLQCVPCVPQQLNGGSWMGKVGGG
jgi:hypothetical protein